MARRFDQEAVPQSVSDEQLVAVLEGRAGEVGKVEAVKELGRRRSSLRSDVLTRLAADAQEAEDVRAAAIVELGHEDSAPARDALVAALRSGEAPVARRAAEALGRVGDHGAFEALASARVPEGPARRSAEFARDLLAYRLGLDGHRLSPPGDDAGLDLEPGDTEPVDVRTPKPETLERALADLARDLPSMTATTAGALALTCGDSEYLVVLNAELGREDPLQRLRAAPAMPAVVLKLSGGLDRYHLHAYVLTHPADDGLELLVSRTTGDVAYVGGARIEGGHAAFSLRSLATPYARPAHIEGVFDGADLTVTLERAVVARTGDPVRTAARQPRKVNVLTPRENSGKP